MADPRNETPLEEPEETDSGWTATRVAIASTAVFIGIVILIFIIALVLAIADVQRAGLIVQLIRDLFLIMVTLELILIGFSVVVLIFQISRSINLVQNEAKPILQNTKDTLDTAKKSAEFVTKNVADPVISFWSFLSGLWTFIRELGGIRRAIRRTRKPTDTGETK